jgi:translin
MDLGIKEIEKRLLIREKELDSIIPKNRALVRLCSNAIKSVHAKDMKVAKKYLQDVEKELEPLREKDQFPKQLNHILQEYVEARVVISAVEKGKIPSFQELKVDPVPYLNGLLDAVGELKREMYESLRHGKKKEAEKFFEMMEHIYDALLPLRFSNAVLPEFRRKQDVARIQTEQARGELL